VTLITLVAQSLGSRALKDGLLYLFFLLALAGVMTAVLLVKNWFVRSYVASSMDSQKQTTFSKGANR
jgi:hypothetical protein